MPNTYTSDYSKSVFSEYIKTKRTRRITILARFPSTSEEILRRDKRAHPILERAFYNNFKRILIDESNAVMRAEKTVTERAREGGIDSSGIEKLGEQAGCFLEVVWNT